jgi:exonuclease SbcC
MFKTLQVTNFRKLRDSTFDFNSGLNAIRGLNEQGKSTLFEALAYAMFGVDALREPWPMS